MRWLVVGFKELIPIQLCSIVQVFNISTYIYV